MVMFIISEPNSVGQHLIIQSLSLLHNMLVCGAVGPLIRKGEELVTVWVLVKYIWDGGTWQKSTAMANDSRRRSLVPC